MLGADQVFQLFKHLVHHCFQLRRLRVSKASLERPEEGGASQVHGDIGSAEELIHLISDSVKLAHCKLGIALDFGKQAPREHSISSLDDCKSDNDLLKVGFCEIDRLLGDSLQEGHNECEFKLLPEVLELFAHRVTDVETLREDPGDVHVVFPDQILHIVRQADFRCHRILTLDVIYLLVGSEW